jgi:hypothetical protein
VGQVALKLKSGDNWFDISCSDSVIRHQCIAEHQPERGAIMAKRRKQSKVQMRGKLPRANSAKRGKARKVANSTKPTKRTAKPKPAPVKKASRKIKQPIAPVVETVAVEVIERPVAVMEVGEMDVGTQTAK